MKEIKRNNIQKYRKHNNMTQEELAEKAGISMTTLSGIEKHKRAMKVYMADKIAKIFGISTKQLWEDEE